MCVPLPIVFFAATAMSAGVNALASIQQGNAQYVAGMQNAQIAERNAQAAEEEITNTQDAAAIERRRLGERVRAAKGEMYAKYGHMGLDPNFGTPSDLIGDTQRAYEIDRSILARNEENATKALDKQVADFRTSSMQSRAAAKGARKAGLLGAAGSFLDMGATVAGKWMSPATTQVKPPPPPSTPSILPTGGY